MKKIAYKPKQVRFFLVFLVILITLVTFRFTKNHPSARIILLAAEVLFVGFFFLQPKLFFPIFRVIMVVTGYIGNFMFYVISTITFYLVLTPIALVMRLFGKEFMQYKIDPTLPTYYEQGSDEHDIEKQF